MGNCQGKLLINPNINNSKIEFGLAKLYAAETMNEINNLGLEKEQRGNLREFYSNKNHFVFSINKDDLKLHQLSLNPLSKPKRLEKSLLFNLKINNIPLKFLN